MNWQGSLKHEGSMRSLEATNVKERRGESAEESIERVQEEERQ